MPPYTRLLVLDGHDPLLSKSIGTKALIPMLVANVLVGLISGCAGVIVALQMVFISPPSFSLHWGLLYICVILLVGYDSLGSIAVGAFLLALLPELLRWFGLGNVDVSAWRGLIVGFAVLIVVLLQAPRPSFGKQGGHQKPLAVCRRRGGMANS